MGLINENAWKVVIRLEFPALGPQNSVHVNVICLLVKSCIICCMSVGYILVCLPFFISGSIQIFAYVVGDFASFLLAKSIFLPGQSLCLLMTSAFFLRKWSFFLENYHFGRKLPVLLENHIFFSKMTIFLRKWPFLLVDEFSVVKSIYVLAQIPSGSPRPSKVATAAPQPGSDSATEAISLEGFHSYWGYPNSWMVVFVFEHLKIKNSWELGVGRPTFGNLHVFIA